jgi:vanillate/3-O-methylgallate O-demethylase
MLSLCTLDVSCCEPGTDVIVVWGNPGSPQTEIRAKVAPAPYKSDNRKLDTNNLPPPKRDAQLSLSR